MGDSIHGARQFVLSRGHLRYRWHRELTAVNIFEITVPSYALTLTKIIFVS